MKAKDDAAPAEIELKLAVSGRDLPRLERRLARFGKGRRATVDNVYYDTADRLLARHRMALRVRHIGRRWLQTLKTDPSPRALSQRGEWEMPAPRGRLDLARFADTPLAALLRAHAQAALRPVFRTRFSRTLWQAEGGAIEIALDQGEIAAARRKAPILELELELKAGAPDVLYRLALSLIGKAKGALALLPSVDSKAVRGYRLAAGGSSQPQKANARALVGDLSGDTTVGEALRAVVERATTLLLVNAAGAGEGDDADPEFVHQARVAVRRMRAVARVLGKPAGWPAAFDGELRRVARALGAVRDWDVFMSQTLPALDAAMAKESPATTLARRAAARRRRAHKALRAVLGSAAFAHLALRLLRWAHQPAAAGRTLAEEAPRRLSRLHEKLLASSTSFAARPADKQHRVRIRAKRLRYALDAFSGALPGKRTAAYVRQLARLQDELGALNDAVVAQAHVRRLARAEHLDAGAAVAFFGRQRQEHVRGAEDALAALAGLPVPWRQ